MTILAARVAVAGFAALRVRALAEVVGTTPVTVLADAVLRTGGDADGADAER